MNKKPTTDETILFSFSDSWKVVIFLILPIMAGYCRNPFNRTSSNTCEISSWKAAYEKTTEAKDSALHVFRETINEMIKNAAELGEAYSISEKVYSKSYTKAGKTSFISPIWDYDHNSCSLSD